MFSIFVQSSSLCPTFPHSWESSHFLSFILFLCLFLNPHISDHLQSNSNDSVFRLDAVLLCMLRQQYFPSAPKCLFIVSLGLSSPSVVLTVLLLPPCPAALHSPPSPIPQRAFQGSHKSFLPHRRDVSSGQFMLMNNYPYQHHHLIKSSTIKNDGSYVCKTHLDFWKKSSSSLSLLTKSMHAIHGCP